MKTEMDGIVSILMEKMNIYWYKTEKNHKNFELIVKLPKYRYCDNIKNRIRRNLKNHLMAGLKITIKSI